MFAEQPWLSRTIAIALLMLLVLSVFALVLVPFWQTATASIETVKDREFQLSRLRISADRLRWSVEPGVDIQSIDALLFNGTEERVKSEFLSVVRSTLSQRSLAPSELRMVQSESVGGLLRMAVWFTAEAKSADVVDAVHALETDEKLIRVSQLVVEAITSSEQPRLRVSITLEAWGSDVAEVVK